MKESSIKIIDSIFDRIEEFWGSDNFRSFISLMLFSAFVVVAIITQLKISNVIPNDFLAFIPKSHLYSIRLTFSLLLTYEVLSMVFSLKNSVSNSIGKQLEILSLVILRHGFKDLVYFEEPLSMLSNLKPMSIFLSDIFGGLIILIILGYYYRIQKHVPITKNDKDKNSFIAIKKSLALLILLYSFIVGGLTLAGFHHGSVYHAFFESLFTFLIFTDILIVFLSLRYSSSYYILFRNSGFALTTVLIRISITAPEYYRVALGVIAVFFALALTWGYTKFQKNIGMENYSNE
jgi:hypothetical protein